MSALSDNRCKQCGKRQDEDVDPETGAAVVAPMLHLASRGLQSEAKHVESYHLDCLPFELEEMHRAKHGPRIDAAKAGVRGEALRAVADNPDPEGE